MTHSTFVMMPIVTIVGQTASGKSDMAMKLAQEFGGEIIAADSRTIYKGMDIGTAKPSVEDQSAVPHHGLDLIEPDQLFSAAEFKRFAKKAIDKIHDQGKPTFIVGGSGLYINGLLYDFEFGNKADPKLRQKLEGMGLDDLQREAERLGISEGEVSYKNRRHLSRAIERGGVVQNRRSLPGNILIVGIEAEALQTRIAARIEQMLASGFENEVQKLFKMYGADAPGLQAPGYKAFVEYIEGRIDFEEAKNRFIQNDKKLAKRQKTWFKRNSDIVWVQSFEQAEKLVSKFLRKFDTIRK